MGKAKAAKKVEHDRELQDVRMARTDLLPVLAKKMREVVSGGPRFHDAAKLTKGNVIDFALVVAELTLSPNKMLIDREDFFTKLRHDVRKHITLLAQLDEEDFSLLFDHLVARSASSSQLE